MLILLAGLVSSVFIKMDATPPSFHVSMERLLKLLKELEGSDVIPRKFLKARMHPTVSEIEVLLDLLCIDENGGVRMDVVDELTTHGYPVYPMERDRYGWLLGAIDTKKGSITFG